MENDTKTGRFWHRAAFNNKTSRNTEQWSKVNDYLRSEVFSLIDERVY